MGGLADLDLVTAPQLRDMVFPPPRFTVTGLLPEGLAMLAGAPKLGKSWMALDLCVAVAQGTLALGAFAVEQGDALYLGLEDSYSRVQRRLASLGDTFPSDLSIGLQLAPLTAGGEDQLLGWLESRPNPRLVVIDTYSRVRPARAKSNDYNDDVRSLASLQRLAVDSRTSILLVHHTRKQLAPQGEDTFDEVLGSRGLTGVVDTTWVLKRGRNTADAILHSTGRDIEEREIALAFEPTTGLWQYRGPAQLTDVTRARQELLRVLARAGTDGITPSAIASALGKAVNGVQQMLGRALDAGQVEKLSGGRYRLAFKVDVSPAAAA